MRIVPLINSFLLSIICYLPTVCMLHKNPVHVQLGVTISAQEKAYLAKRMPIVQATLEKTLDRSLETNYIPRIALLGSGGGDRAACLITGGFDGLKKIGLFDALSLMVGVSGSTWGISAYATSAPATTEKPLDEFNVFKASLRQSLQRSFFDVTEQEKQEIEESVAFQKENLPSLTLGTLYGALLAKVFLANKGGEKQVIPLSQQAEALENASIPYPVYAAIDARDEVSDDPPRYAITPYHLTNITHQTSIPTYACGCIFKNGIATEQKPEPPLSLFLGAFGSAFAANLSNIISAVASGSETAIKLHDLWEEFIVPYVPTILQKIAQKIAQERLLPFWAKLPNYTYKMEGQENAHKANLKLADMGLAENIPLAQAMQYQPDIMLIIDASAGSIGQELRKIEQYAHTHTIPFPPIDYTSIATKTMSIFKSDVPGVPVIIYLPRISDKALWEKYKTNPACSAFDLDNFDLDYEANHGGAETQDFSYTEKLSGQVMDQAAFNIWANRKAIKQVINELIDKKS